MNAPTKRLSYTSWKYGIFIEYYPHIGIHLHMNIYQQNGRCGGNKRRWLLNMLKKVCVTYTFV